MSYVRKQKYMCKQKRFFNATMCTQEMKYTSKIDMKRFLYNKSVLLQQYLTVNIVEYLLAYLFTLECIHAYGCGPGN